MRCFMKLEKRIEAGCGKCERGKDRKESTLWKSGDRGMKDMIDEQRGESDEAFLFVCKKEREDSEEKER